MKSSTANNHLFLNIIITALAPIIWGTTYIVTTELLPADKPLLASVMRVLPVGLLLTLWSRKLPIYRQGLDFDKNIFIKIIILSFLNITCFQALLFVSAYRLAGGISAVIGSVQPLIIMGLIAIVHKEPPKLTTFVAIILSMVGMFLLLVHGTVELDVIGVLSALFGAVSMAVGMFLAKRWKPNVDNITFTGWQLLFGGVMLLPLLLLFEDLPTSLSQTNLLGYAYLAIFSSLIAYTLWFRGIDKINTVAVSILGALSPITATVIGWVYLNQSLTLVQLIGFVIVIFSVVGVQVSHAQSVEN